MSQTPTEDSADLADLLASVTSSCSRDAADPKLVALALTLGREAADTHATAVPLPLLLDFVAAVQGQPLAGDADYRQRLETCARQFRQARQEQAKTEGLSAAALGGLLREFWEQRPEAQAKQQAPKAQAVQRHADALARLDTRDGRAQLLQCWRTASGRSRAGAPPKQSSATSSETSFAISPAQLFRAFAARVPYAELNFHAFDCFCELIEQERLPLDRRRRDHRGDPRTRDLIPRGFACVGHTGAIMMHTLVLGDLGEQKIVDHSDLRLTSRSTVRRPRVVCLGLSQYFSGKTVRDVTALSWVMGGTLVLLADLAQALTGWPVELVLHRAQPEWQTGIDAAWREWFDRKAGTIPPPATAEALRRLSGFDLPQSQGWSAPLDWTDGAGSLLCGVLATDDLEAHGYEPCPPSPDRSASRQVYRLAAATRGLPEEMAYVVALAAPKEAQELSGQLLACRRDSKGDRLERVLAADMRAPAPEGASTQPGEDDCFKVVRWCLVARIRDELQRRGIAP